MSRQERVVEAWDDMAGDWDDIAVGSAKAFYAILRQHIEITHDMVVFDFGCGTGLVADLLRRQVKKIVAVDVSSCMVDLMEDKILAEDWDNVQVFHALMGDSEDETSEEILLEHEGKVDLILASSVLGFVTKESVASTMAALGRLLKPGGYFCHTDTPKSEVKHYNAFTKKKAQTYYEKGGLEMDSTSIVKFDVSGSCCDVFLGIAHKL